VSHSDIEEVTHSLGSKPTINVNGDGFETDTTLGHVKSLLIDMFQSSPLPAVGVDGAFAASSQVSSTASHFLPSTCERIHFQA